MWCPSGGDQRNLRRSKAILFHLLAWYEPLIEELAKVMLMKFVSLIQMVKSYEARSDLIRLSPRIIWHYLILPNFLIPGPASSTLSDLHTTISVYDIYYYTMHAHVGP